MSKKKRRIVVSIVFICVLYAMLFLLLIAPEKGKKNSAAKGNTESESQTVTEYETVTEATEVTEIVEEEPEVSLVMVGDMLMHTRVMNSGKQEDGTYNFDHLFRYVGAEISAADIAIVNQETILGGTELGLSSYPTFNSPYEVGDAESKVGFDVILQATNHAVDKGAQGILNDINFWRSNYPSICCLGIYDSQEAQDADIYYYEEDGIRIAILNYTFGTNGISLPDGMPYAVNLLDEDQMTKDIQNAHANADFIVVCPHWGTEYNFGIDSKQEYWTQYFLSQGVDLVIGTHPHVIEPIEWVSDDQGNSMLVYYSIGNFVNGTESYDGSPADRMVGGIAEVTIGYDEQGQVAITDYGVEPLVCHMAEGTNYTVYYLKDYTEELAAQNEIKNQDSDFSLEYCKELVANVWPELN